MQILISGDKTAESRQVIRQVNVLTQTANISCGKFKVWQLDCWIELNSPVLHQKQETKNKNRLMVEISSNVYPRNLKLTVSRCNDTAKHELRDQNITIKKCIRIHLKF